MHMPSVILTLGAPPLVDALLLHGHVASLVALEDQLATLLRQHDGRGLVRPFCVGFMLCLLKHFETINKCIGVRGGRGRGEIDGGARHAHRPLRQQPRLVLLHLFLALRGNVIHVKLIALGITTPLLHIQRSYWIRDEGRENTMTKPAGPALCSVSSPLPLFMKIPPPSYYAFPC